MHNFNKKYKIIVMSSKPIKVIVTWSFSIRFQIFRIVILHPLTPL